MRQTENYYQSVPPHPHQLDDGMDHFEFELSTHPVRVLSESEQHPPTNFEQSEGYFLKFCSLLSVFTTLCLFSTILLHAFCITATTSFSQSGSCFEFFYRLYGMLFAAIGFFCEMEWTEGIRTTSLLQYWTTRGLFYIFIALLTIQEYGDVRYHNILISKAAFVQGILLICFGMAYTCMVS